MSVVVKLVALGHGGPHPDLGRYLRSWDIDARHGRGEIACVDTPAEAYKFPDATEAMRVWKMRSKILPTRPDGQPNRPLTAFTIEIEPAP